MWEDRIPKRRIGTLSPLGATENAAYEFYRIAPKDVMAIYLPIGLQKFSPEDVERVFGPVDGFIEYLLDRDVDIIVQSGVPLPKMSGVTASNGIPFSYSAILTFCA